MNKIEMITGIVEVCDENTELKHQLAKLQQDMQSLCAFGMFDRPGDSDSEQNPGRAKIEAQMLLIGQKRVYEDAVYSWENVNVYRGDDGNIKAEKFEKFRKAYVHNVPPFMSQNEFYEYYDTMLRSDYERKKEEAVENLKKKEASDDEAKPE